MMRIEKTRFGEIELEAEKTIVFPGGLVGFADSKRYVLLEPRGPGRVAWLQSLDMPELAFPVIDGSRIAAAYPHPSPEDLAREAGLGTSELALLVVVAVHKDKGNRLVANLLAPLVVDLEARLGAQVVLDPRRYSAAAPLGEAAPATHAAMP